MLVSTDQYEMDALEKLANEAGDAIRNMFWMKHDEGLHGWDDPKKIVELITAFEERLEEGRTPRNMVHIMSLAALIWNQLCIKENEKESKNE